MPPADHLADGELRTLLIGDPARGWRAFIGQVIGGLPPEDAAIVRLKYVEGLSPKQIRAALHLDELSEQRVGGILETLKARLADRHVGALDASALGLTFFERGQP